jgi:hypothetical protein
MEDQMNQSPDSMTTPALYREEDRLAQLWAADLADSSDIFRLVQVRCTLGIRELEVRSLLLAA